MLKNQLENLNEEDPNLLQDMEEIFELAGLREPFEKTIQTVDPRYLQTAMKSSEMFHCKPILARHIGRIRLFSTLQGLSFFLRSPKCCSFMVCRGDEATAWHPSQPDCETWKGTV